MKSVMKVVGPRIFKSYPYEELYLLEGCKRVRDRVKNAQLVYIGGCHTRKALKL